MIAVLSAEAELPAAAGVWGRENRVLPAAEREALSWLTLARLLGWEVEVGYDPREPGFAAGARCIVVARDPGAFAADEVAALASIAEGGALLVTGAAPPGSPLAELAGVAAAGERRLEGALRWIGPGDEREWEAWPEVSVATLRSHEGSDPSRTEGATWALVGDAPLAVAQPVGRGFVATLAAHPAELADAAPSGSGLLKRLLTWGVPGPLAWLDLDGFLVLRMDDPGSASSAHLDGWAHRSLSEEEWRRLTRDLASREARITVGYVPGWLDDGDPGRGELRVGGEPVDRVAGRVHPSNLVTYARSTGEASQDNPAGWRGIEALRDAGAGEVELHGYTHVRPVYGGESRGGGPYSAWAASEDRYEGVHWYRELEALAPPPADERGPVAAGLELFRERLGARPAALCCPGHACSPLAAASAAELGLDLIAAESLALRVGERLAWCDHVRNPYIDGAAGPWLESGLPVVACLHDRDVVVDGSDWFGQRLDEWSARGARRFGDLRELAAILQRSVSVSERDGSVQVAGGVRPLSRDLPLEVRDAGAEVSRRLLLAPGEDGDAAAVAE